MYENKTEVIEAYDAVSQMYADKYSDEILVKPIVQQYLADFVKPIPPGGLICDMGCGPGQVARYLKNNLHRNTTGVDLSPKMIEIASAINHGITFSAADVLQMEEPGLYDGIIGLYFIVNFPTPALPQVFSKLNQLLKDKGKLLISFHIGNDELNRVNDFWGSGKACDFYFFNPETVAKHLMLCGFKVTDIRFREPNPDVEYPSQRAYIFAEK
jgi:2-polyprenyl-3-methyl-5-hydroxy-6-metoxy-1,4-benzoquinol methylase